MVFTAHHPVLPPHHHRRPQELSSVQREILEAIQTCYDRGIPITVARLSHCTGYEVRVVEPAVAQLLTKHLIRAIVGEEDEQPSDMAPWGGGGQRCLPPNEIATTIAQESFEAQGDCH
ncbi:MAG: hypothetical protein Fur0042_11270 [Cyanophyceae cyanobacterium]